MVYELYVSRGSWEGKGWWFMWEVHLVRGGNERHSFGDGEKEERGREQQQDEMTTRMIKCWQHWLISFFKRKNTPYPHLSMKWHVYPTRLWLLLDLTYVPSCFYGKLVPAVSREHHAVHHNLISGYVLFPARQFHMPAEDSS